MIKIVTTDTYKKLTAEGEWSTNEWKDLIELDNNIKIRTKSDIMSYIELQDKVIVLTKFTTIDSYHRLAEIQQKIGYKYVDTLDEHTSVYGGNIFCYSKEDGKLLWQVESKEDSPYVNIYLKMSRKVDCHINYKDETKQEDWGITLNEEFIKDKDKIEVRTFSCRGYEMDIDTGKVKFVYQGK